MRIRGVKTELEEAGEDTEGMVTNTAKLQEKIMALTNIDGNGGVNILADDGSFKSTYKILLEISKVWEKIDDASRAGLLEVLAGKVRGSTVAALLSSGDIMESAYESASNASGSAQEELDKYLDSIDGKVALFNNSLQTMWMNLIDSEFIKSIVDAGTGLIKFLDTVPGKITAIIAALAGFSKLKGFSLLGLGQDAIKNINRLQQAAASLNFLKQVSPVSNLSAEGINSYASAVSNLTATQQANMLASAGLSTSQIQLAMQYNNLSEDVIREATAHVFAKTTTEQEAAAETALFTVKSQHVAASLRAQAATIGEAKAKELNAAISILESGASKDVMIAKLNEALSSGEITKATYREIAAKLGLASANNTLAGTIKAIFASMGPVGWISLALSAIPLIAQGIDAITVSAEELREEVKELKDTYEDARQTFSKNITDLTTSSDTKVYETLEDEFRALTKGVDQYGNNLSLTTDQYERYKEICEKIVGVNPEIASGYDSVTEAIGNNVDVLSELINVQKIQARYNAKEFVNDENLETLTEEAWLDVEEANNKLKQYESYVVTQKNSIDRDMAEKFMQSGFVQAFNPSEDHGYNAMLATLQKLGKSSDEATNELKKYFTRGIYDSTSFFTDYIQEIYENIHKFEGIDGNNLVAEFFASMKLDGMDYGESLEEYFGLQDDAEEARKELERAQNGLIDTLLHVPYSTKEYENLGDESQNFLVNWIKSSSMFKIDPSWNKTTRQEKAKEMRDSIIKMIEMLADDMQNIDYNGESISMQDFIGQIVSFDKASVDYGEYRKQIGTMLKTLYDSLTEEQKKQFGINDFFDFQSFFGFDFLNDDKNRKQAVDQIANFFGGTEEEIKKHKEDIIDNLNKLNAEEVEAFSSIDWNKYGTDVITDWQVVMDIVHKKIAAIADVMSVKTYSALKEEIDAYNDALSQTEEIISNNTEVTQEYKDAIIALGVSEEELNKYFDENNKLVVKDAKGLNSLVKSAKKNTIENIKLAKSQARLQYYELYKKMRPYYDAQGKLINRSKTEVLALYAEMGALQKTISEYSRLETQLLGTINAYEKFQSAQEVDATTDYVGGIEEMVMGLGEAFNTAELGSETARAAIEGIVPESVYEHLDTVDEKLAAIYSYYKEGKIAQYFSLEFDDDGAITSAEMKLGNLRTFIEDGLADGIFAGGDWQHFEFSEAFLKEIEQFGTAEEKLQYLADKFKVTKDVLFAIIESINDHDAEWLNGDYGSMFDPFVSKTLEDSIYETVDALADLEVQFASDKITVDQYAEQYTALSGTLDELGESARTDIAKCEELTTKIAEQKKEVDDLTSKINAMRENGMKWDEIKLTTEYKDLIEASGVLTELSKQLEGIEITEVVIQLALDNIDSEIAQIEKDLQNKINFGDDGEYTVKVGVQLTDDELAIMEQYKKLWEERHNIEVEANPDDAKTALEMIESAAQSALDVIDSIDGTTITINTSSAVSNVNELYDALKNLGTVDTATVTVDKPTVVSGGGVGSASSKWASKHYIMHADGTAHASGDWGLQANEHDSLVGELGPELVVDPQSGRYYTVGDNGAEFVDLKRGSIIFNHKQTESLLKNGYVTSRGKAYAEGNAHVTLWSNGSSTSQWEGTGWDGPTDESYDLSDALSSAADSASDFNDTLDWITIRMEEYEELISKYSAKLENAIGASNKNNLIDLIIGQLDAQKKDYHTVVDQGIYARQAESYIAGLSDDLQNFARNGALAISLLPDDVTEEQMNAIEKYREFAALHAEAETKIIEIESQISDYRKQQFDNIAAEHDNALSRYDSAIAEYEAQNDFLESRTGFASEDIYKNIKGELNNKINQNKLKRDALQAELDTGKIKEGTDAWYEAVNAIDEVDAEIINLNTELENTQNSINDLHWAKFDELINRYDYIKNEAQNLIDIMSDKDMFVTPDNENGWREEDVSWTGEGLATIGEYARQMDIAKQSADEYAKEIAYLKENKDKYNESEYLEKLNELTDAQYEQIEAYQDAKDAIVDLNKERIETIKDGIQKEIDAYEELIEKKKEELSASKEAYDFQKNVAEQSKNIADIERKLAALAYDDSASARAKKAQLEAELYEAQADLEETYYDQSISNQQDALDKELEDFQTEKEAELEKWDKYLDDVETIIQDSLGIVQSNVGTAYDALTKTANDYNITLSDYITKPWDDAIKKVSSFSDSTVNELDKIKTAWQEVADAIDDATGKQENADVSNNKPQNNADDKKPGSAPHASSGITEKDKYGVALAIWNGNYGWGNGRTRINNLTAKGFDAKEIQTIVDTIGRDRYVRTGAWKGKYHGITDLAPYHLNKFAKGSTGVGKDQWAIIDELGEELQFVPGKNGRLEYIKKGTGIVPADLTKRLIDMAMDPQDMLDRNRPSIGAPHIINNEVNIDCSVGTMVHIEHCDQNTLPDVERLVNKAFDKHMQTLNNSIRKFTR